MSETPRVDELTLAKLIQWTDGYLQRKRALKTSVPIEESERNFALDLWTGIKSALQELRTLRGKNPLEGFQARVYDWMRNCFQRSDALFPTQRSFRFLEEALELAQASGTTHEQALRLVAYVYTRPAGDVHQEIGGVMVTLSGLATSFGYSIDHAAETELARCNDNTEKIRAKDLAKPERSPLPTEDEQGPMWIPTLQVESLMRDVKTRTTDKVEIDRKILEGLLHDSLLWREDRARAQALNALPNRNEAIDAYVSQFNATEYRTGARELPSIRLAFADGWDACYMQRPHRALAGQFEVGATEDRREVAINAPFVPDNGSGKIHFAFTPRQAIGLAETLFRKAADCLPQFSRGERRSSTLIDMAISRATTLRGTHITNPEHDYIVALADEYLAMKGLVNLWQTACTGRHGSQHPCVKMDKTS